MKNLVMSIVFVGLFGLTVNAQDCQNGVCKIRPVKAVTKAVEHVVHAVLPPYNGKYLSAIRYNLPPVQYIGYQATCNQKFVIRCYRPCR